MIKIEKISFNEVPQLSKNDKAYATGGVALALKNHESLAHMLAVDPGGALSRASARTRPRIDNV